MGEVVSLGALVWYTRSRAAPSESVSSPISSSARRRSMDERTHTRTVRPFFLSRLFFRLFSIGKIGNVTSGDGVTIK